MVAGSAKRSTASLLREELQRGVHGEVDEESWRLKQALLRRQTNVRKETKLFRDYARQSFIDTLTLYLHGVCCDIDVETGPRQLPSRYLRKRLNLLYSLYPPPDGYAVFPEHLKAAVTFRTAALFESLHAAGNVGFPRRRLYSQ